MLNSIFNIVYDLHLVGEEEVFYEWRNNGTESFGRGIALLAVEGFFVWLAIAKQESDEKDSDYIHALRVYPSNFNVLL